MITMTVLFNKPLTWRLPGFDWYHFDGTDNELLDRNDNCMLVFPMLVINARSRVHLGVVYFTHSSSALKSTITVSITHKNVTQYRNSNHVCHALEKGSRARDAPVQQADYIIILVTIIYIKLCKFWNIISFPKRLHVPLGTSTTQFILWKWRNWFLNT